MNRLQLQTKRQALLRQLQNLGPWIEGTLVATTRKCGKEGCACHHNGPKHPVLFLTWKEAGKTISLYIPRQLESAVKEWAHWGAQPMRSMMPTCQPGWRLSRDAMSSCAPS